MASGFFSTPAQKLCFLSVLKGFDKDYYRGNRIIFRRIANYSCRRILCGLYSQTIVPLCGHVKTPNEREPTQANPADQQPRGPRIAGFSCCNSTNKNFILHPFQIHFYHEKHCLFDDGVWLLSWLGHGTIEPPFFDGVCHGSPRGLLAVVGSGYHPCGRCP